MDIEEAIEILKHSLGLTYKEIPYRNYYAAGKGDIPMLDDLVKRELMRRGREQWGYVCYHVTELGELLALENMPKYTRAQKRYQRFLDVSDACPDLTFREFLTDPYWREARNGH